MVEFADSVKNDAFARSHGICECRRANHRHTGGRCRARITRWGAVFNQDTVQMRGPQDSLENCVAMCVACHRGNPARKR